MDTQQKFVSHQTAVATFTSFIAQATKTHSTEVKNVSLLRLEAIVEVGFTRGRLFVQKLQEMGAGSRVHWARNHEFYPDDVVDVTKMTPTQVLELVFKR